jgi:hypothetical protein
METSMRKYSTHVPPLYACMYMFTSTCAYRLLLHNSCVHGARDQGCDTRIAVCKFLYSFVHLHGQERQRGRFVCVWPLRRLNSVIVTWRE